jgi:drug/metabolite transporter (DMT)-like permease
MGRQGRASFRTVQQRSFLLLLVAAAAWGAGNVSQKTALEHLGPLTLTGLTSLIASLLLAPAAAMEKKDTNGPLSLLIPVLAVFTIAVTLLQVGYGGTSVSNAGFIVNLSAILTPVIGWMFLGEKPGRHVMAAGLMAASGVWLLGGGGLTTLRWGDWVCLMAAASFSLWFILAGRLLAFSRAPHSLSFQQMLFSGVLATALGLWLEPTSWHAVAAAWPELLIIGVVSKGVAYGLQSLSQMHLQPSTVAIIVSSEALFGAAAARLFLGETLSVLGLAGAGLVMASIALANAEPQGWRPARGPGTPVPARIGAGRGRRNTAGDPGASASFDNHARLQ